MKKKVFYFGLEPLKARYTYQLSKEWMPATFAEYDNLEFIDVPGEFDPDQQIKVGAVLDAVGRGKFAMSQCASFLDMLNRGMVSDGDVIFLQDFWHPGIESIFYALDLYNINVKFYSMLHAQSVDEYDFTWAMRDWMRPIELGIDKRMAGIFVGSTIHKEQLRAAGFNAPIHVVSLPLHKELTLKVLPNYDELRKEPRKKVIVYTSRFDKEKNPFFMLEVAKQFLKCREDYEWHITTSGKHLRSMMPGAVEALINYSIEEPRFKILTGLSKEEYYTELATGMVLFNTSLQDYVSWTVLEGTTFGIDVMFPNFRSFPEFVPADRMYHAFDLSSALTGLLEVTKQDHFGCHYDFAQVADLGRRMEGWIVANEPKFEINVWHERALCEHLLKQDNQ